MQRREHGEAEQTVLRPDDGVDVRVERVAEGRDEDARRGEAHLVLVEVGLREPVLVERLGHQAAFDLRQHEGVAVVVVPGVVVVEPGHRGQRVLGVLVLVVPVGHHDLPVGVEAGDEQEDDVVEHVARPGRILGRQAMHRLEHHLRGADLGRVDVAGDEQDGRGTLRQARRFFVAQVVGVGQAPLRGFDFIQARQVPRRGDDDHHKRVAARRLAELLHHDAVARRVHFLQILDNLLPPHYLPFRPHPEAGELLRRLELRPGGHSQRNQQGHQQERTSEARPHHVTSQQGRILGDRWAQPRQPYLYTTPPPLPIRKMLLIRA